MAYDENRQMLPEDLKTVLESISTDKSLNDRGSSRWHPKMQSRASEMALALELMTEGFEGELFNREGEAWPEADVTIVDLGQGDLMSGEQFPRELLEATLPYWTRFMAWTARELYQTEDRCLVQLGRLFRRLIVEPRKVRSFNLSFGRIELHMSGRDINECQYLYAYDDASLEDYLEEIMAGNLTPVRFEARVLYHNDSELNVFTRDTDVIDVEHPHVSDWQTVVSEALDWIRQERASLNKITTLRPTLKLAA